MQKTVIDSKRDSTFIKLIFNGFLNLIYQKT